LIFLFIVQAKEVDYLKTENTKKYSPFIFIGVDKITYTICHS